MRDLHDHHEREMMLDLTGERRPVPQMGRGGPAEPAEGGPAISTHAGSGMARKAAHGSPDAVRDAMRAGLRAHVVIDDATADALMLAARVYVHSLWDHAVALAAEDGPVPLIGVEAWVEPLSAFAARLQAHYWHTDLAGYDRVTLEDLGNMADLPRARLVPTPRVFEETRP